MVAEKELTVPISALSTRKRRQGVYAAPIFFNSIHTCLCFRSHDGSARAHSSHRLNVERNASCALGRLSVYPLIGTPIVESTMTEFRLHNQLSAFEDWCIR